jgi:hypothetical protein
MESEEENIAKLDAGISIMHKMFFDIQKDFFLSLLSLLSF